MQELEREIRTFIVENFLFGEEGRVVNGNDSFLEMGIIDSTGVLELVAFVEGRFGVKVNDSEVIPDNLDTVDALVRFVQRKSSLSN